LGIYSIDQSALGRFLDYLELESIRKHSRLTEEQAAGLADEIDHAVGESNCVSILSGALRSFDFILFRSGCAA
jgi:hypothetical protein